MVPLQQLMAGAAWWQLATTNCFMSADDLQVIEHMP